MRTKSKATASPEPALEAPPSEAPPAEPSITTASMDELQKEIARRQKRASWLLDKRATVAGQLASIDAEIRACGINPQGVHQNGAAAFAAPLGMSLSKITRKAPGGGTPVWQRAYAVMEAGKTYSAKKVRDALHAAGDPVPLSQIYGGLRLRTDAFDQVGPGQYAKRVTAQAGAATDAAPLAPLGDLKAKVEALGPWPFPHPVPKWQSGKPTKCEMAIRLGRDGKDFNVRAMIEKINATGIIHITKVHYLSNPLGKMPKYFTKVRAGGVGRGDTSIYRVKLPKS